GHRVVRGGEHDAEVDVVAARQVRDARGGQDAQDRDVDACAREARDDGGLEELPRGARVAAHDGARAVALERSRRREDVCCGDGQVEGELRREVTVGKPTDPVRAEEAAHRWSAEGRASALGVLGRLAGLLQTRLLTLDDAGVAREEASLLERGAVVLGVDLVERTSDAEAQRTGLTRAAAAGDAGDDVEPALDLD